MATKEEYEHGQRALAKSKSKILCLLNKWNYEENGEPSPQKLARLIPMGIETVYRHYADFKAKIFEINQQEQKRLKSIELDNERIRQLYLKNGIKYNSE